MKALLPITIIIILVTTLAPGTLSFLDSFSMIINALAVYSIGWVAAGFVYRVKSDNYNVVRHIALASIFAVPIVAIIFVPTFLYPYIVGKAFTFRFLAIILFCSSLYLALTDENHKPVASPFVLAYLLFALVMLLATMFSMDPSRSFWSNYERMEGYINLLCLFVLAIGTTVVKLKELEWNRVFGVHIVVSTIVSTVAILQYFIGILSLKAMGSLPILSLCLAQGAACRSDSTLGNSIYLGIYSALTFWIIIYAIFGKKVKGSLFPVLAFINFFAAYFSGTRGVWLGMFLGLGVLVVSKYWFDGKRKAAIGSVVAGGLFLICFAGFIYYAKMNNIAQDVAIVQRFSSVNTLFARWELWKTTLIAWEHKPILGWGQENFIHAFNLYYNPAMYGQETYFDHPHNTYLGWLIFGGILGFLAFLVLLFSSVWGIIKSNLEQEEKNDLIIPILLALIVTYCVHIFFVFDNLTSSLLFVLISVYFGSRYTIGSLRVPTLPKGTYPVLGGVLIVVGLFFVWKAIYKPSVANMETIYAMTYQQHAVGQTPVQIIQGTQKAYEDAINEDTFGSYEIREFYLQKSLEFINLMQQVQDPAAKDAILRLAQSALEQFAKQIDNNSFDHRAHFMLGLYYLNIHNYDLAIQTLQKALALAPNKQIALIYLAKAYILKGDVENASQYYERAIAITPTKIGGYNQIRTEYIQVLLVSNQNEKAVMQIRDLIPTTNKDDLASLVGQMNQLYSQKSDLKDFIKILNQAYQADPANQNYPLWLAEAYAVEGDYNTSVSVINSLQSASPNIVAGFSQLLGEYVRQKQAEATK